MKNSSVTDAGPPLLPIVSFYGERNTAHPERHPLGALKTARNVDIDDTGCLERRAGYALAAEIAGVSGAFAPRHQQYLYLVANGALLRMDAEDRRRELATGLPAGPYFWAEAADAVYLSAAGYKAVITGSGAAPWAIPEPPQPAVAAVDGDLPAGTYLVATVYRDVDGRQGPASSYAAVTAATPCALAINAPPAVDGLGRAYSVLVFISGPDAEALHLTLQSRGGASLWNGPLDLRGYVLDREQSDCQPPPLAGEAIAFYEGSLWLALHDDPSDTSVVLRSKPFWPQLFDPSQDGFSVPGRVRGLAESAGGLLVATDRDVWVYAETGVRRIANYGVPEGVPITVTPEQVAYLWTYRGLLQWPAGEDLNLTDTFVSLPPGSWCSVAMVEQDGGRRAVVLTDGAGMAHNAYHE